MIHLLYYAIVTVVLARVDAWRIKQTWGQKNIGHVLSGFLAAAGMTVYYLPIFDKSNIALFALSCALIRVVVYAPVLNKFRGLKIDYESSTTSSWFDQLTKSISFWGVRIIGFALLVIVQLIKFLK